MVYGWRVASGIRLASGDLYHGMTAACAGDAEVHRLPACARISPTTRDPVELALWRVQTTLSSPKRHASTRARELNA